MGKTINITMKSRKAIRDTISNISSHGNYAICDVVNHNLPHILYDGMIEFISDNTLEVYDSSSDSEEYTYWESKTDLDGTPTVLPYRIVKEWVKSVNTKSPKRTTNWI